MPLWLIATIITGLGWGIGGIALGRAAREVSPPLLTAIYNSLAAVLFFSLFVTSNEVHYISLNTGDAHSELIRALVAGTIGGLGFALGLTALSAGLAKGRTSIIGPVNATFVILAVFAYALLANKLPTAWAIVGVGFLICVPWLVAQTNHRAEHVTTTIGRDINFGIFIGLGFAVYMISLAEAPPNLRLFMFAIIQLVSCLSMLLVHIRSKRTFKISRAQSVPALIFIAMELIAVVAIRIAFNSGSPSIVTALSTVCEISSMLLCARIFNKEKFSQFQIVGAVFTCIGIVLVVLNT